MKFLSLGITPHPQHLLTSTQAERKTQEQVTACNGYGSPTLSGSPLHLAMVVERSA
jgi:hypothetical protein